MSLPMSKCLFKKAVTNPEKFKARLLDTVKYNVGHGAFTMHPCKCEPRCTLDQADGVALDKMLLEGLNETQYTTFLRMIQR